MKDSLSCDGTGHLQGRGTPPCIVMVATWYIQGRKGILGKCVNEKWVWRAGGCWSWNLQSTLTTGNTSPSPMRSVAELQAWGTLRDLGSGKTILGIVDVEMQLVLRVKQVLWATNCVLRFCRDHSTGLGPVLFTGLTSGYMGQEACEATFFPPK